FAQQTPLGVEKTEIYIGEVIDKQLHLGGPLGKSRHNSISTFMTRLRYTLGVEVSTTLVPGETVGTSDLHITAAPTPLVNGTIELDNFGNKYTGEYRLGGSLRVNSPFGLGDRFDLR